MSVVRDLTKQNLEIDDICIPAETPTPSSWQTLAMGETPPPKSANVI